MDRNQAGQSHSPGSFLLGGKGAAGKRQAERMQLYCGREVGRGGLCSRLEAKGSPPSPSSLFQCLGAVPSPLSVFPLMPRARKDLQNNIGLKLPFSLTPKFWVLLQTSMTHFFLKCPFLRSHPICEVSSEHTSWVSYYSGSFKKKLTELIWD